MNNALDQETRPEYYDGQYLGADDMTAAVRYARVARARHALGAHTWGIAVGLELVERQLATGDVEIVLTPGVAWDGYGRALVVTAPEHVPLDLFARFDDVVPDAGAPVEVWISYREIASGPPGVGFACPDDELNGRVLETFRFELRRVAVKDAHLVTIASRALDARNALSTFDPRRTALFDESVPEQQYPERGDAPRWPLFVGVVRWKNPTGLDGRLIASIPEDRTQARAQRRYLGAIGESILAPDGVLRLRDRWRNPSDPIINFKTPSLDPTVVNDLVWCEGHLRVIGDVRLQAGKLDYRVERGGDEGVPIYLERSKKTVGTTTSTSLEAFVAPPVDSGPGTEETRFVVSTLKSNARVERFTVVTDGRVGINTDTPTNNLDVRGDTGIRHGFSYVTSDAAWAAFAFNAYSPPGGPWVVPDATHRPAALVLDDVGAVPTFRFQTSMVNPPDWKVHAVLKGDTGNLGIGLQTPLAKLHLHSANPLQGDLQLLSASADFEYDGGSDKLFIFKDTQAGTTAFVTGKFAIGTTAPLARFHVVQDAHLNAIFDRSDMQEHLTVVVGSAGSGLRFSATNEFFIASQPYANRGDGSFGNEHLRIKADGRVGIGTSDPQTALHVVGNRIRLGTASKHLDLRTDGSSVDLQSETDNLYLRSSGAGGKNNVIINAIAGDGNVGIGLQNPLTKLDISGDLQVNGNAFVNFGGLWTTSDVREKEDIRPIQRPLERVLALKGITFAFKQQAKRAAAPERQHGFVAQDVEQVFPEWVRDSPSGAKAVNTSGLSAVLVEAVRELSERCDALSREVEELRTRLGAETDDGAPKKAEGRRAKQKKGS